MPEEKSVDMPVLFINSFTNCEDFIKVRVAPIKRSWLNMLLIPSFMIAKESKSTNDITICTSKRANKLFNQHLKNPDVFIFIKNKKENGDISIKSLVMIYLIEKDSINEKDEMEIMPEIIPLKEKMLNLSLAEVLYNFEIKLEKDISWLNIFFPKAQIKFDISLVIEKIPEQIEKEQHTIIPITTALTKNFGADSISPPV